LAAGVIGLMALAWGWRQPDNPVTNFRHVLAVAGSHAWVHGVTTVTTATDRFDFETWFSPSQRLAAMRSAKFLQHTNYKTGMQTSYHLASAELRQSLANPHGEHFGRAFVIALLNDGDLQAAMPFHRVSGVNKLLVADGHRPLVQYQFQVSWRSNTSVGWLTTVLVDTDDQRIVSWEERHTNGTVILTRFDYPTTGPDDIYQLGAPLDAVWASDQHPLDESP
jgi:hypothetical protein